MTHTPRGTFTLEHLSNLRLWYRFEALSALVEFLHGEQITLYFYYTTIRRYIYTSCRLGRWRRIFHMIQQIFEWIHGFIIIHMETSERKLMQLKKPQRIIYYWDSVVIFRSSSKPVNFFPRLVGLSTKFANHRYVHRFIFRVLQRLIWPIKELAYNFVGEINILVKHFENYAWSLWWTISGQKKAMKGFQKDKEEDKVLESRRLVTEAFVDSIAVSFGLT